MQNIIDDEVLFEAILNPLWPSSHAGYQYRPFDISWRPDNIEIYHALIKLPSAIQQDTLQFKKQCQAMTALPTQNQQVSVDNVQSLNVFGQQYFESSNQQDNFAEVKKQVEQSSNVFRTIQVKVIENMIRYFGEFHQIPFIMIESVNQCLQNYDFQKVKKLYPYIALSQALNLMHRTMAKHNAMNPLVLDHSANTQLLHDVLEIFQTSEQQSAFLFKYYCSTNKLDSGFLVPRVEKQMLQNPLLHGYLLLKLYKANILRQLGFIKAANHVYEELLVLSAASPGQSFPLFPNSYAVVGMATCKCHSQSNGTNQESLFPDVRIPFILGQFMAGNGVSVLKYLQNGVFADYGEEQEYFHENFCRAVCYFDEYYKNVDTRDFISEEAIDRLSHFNGKQLNQRYQQLTAVSKLVYDSRIDCNCICCSREQDSRVQQKSVQLVCQNVLQNVLLPAEQRLEGNNRSARSNFAAQIDISQTKRKDARLGFAQCQIVNPILSGPKFKSQHIENDECKSQDISYMQTKPQYSYNCTYNLPNLLPHDECIIKGLQQENIFALAQAENLGAHYAPLREITDSTQQQPHAFESCMFEKPSSHNFDAVNTQFNAALSQQLLCPPVAVSALSEKTQDYYLIDEIIQTYRKSENPSILNVPISRFLFFGDYQQDLEINIDFSKTPKLFAQGSQDQFINSSFFNKNGELLNGFISSTALYSDMLLFLNKRAIWANFIASLINKSEILSKCCCGTCLQSIAKNLSPSMLTNGIGLKCGQLDTFIRTLLKQYPVPQLPSLNILYTAFQANSFIAEYLLGYKKLPDVATLRMFYTLFDEQQLLEPEAYKFQKLKRLNLNRTPYLGLTRTQIRMYQAAMYVSDFGHFWQSDELVQEIEELAKKIDIIDGQTIKSKIGFSAFNTAHYQVFNQTNEYLKYSALDFLNQAYKSYVEFEMIKSLNSNNILNISYCDQVYHVYKLNNNEKGGMEDFDEQYMLMNDMARKFKNQNMFQVSDLYLNMQTYQHYKATIYLAVFDRYIQQQIQKSYEDKSQSFSQKNIANIQLIVARFLGEMLFIMPDLKLYPILKQIYCSIYQQSGQSIGYQTLAQTQSNPIAVFTGDLLNVIVQQLTKIIQDFMFTQSQTKVQKTVTKKDKVGKKKSLTSSTTVAQQNQTQQQSILAQTNFDDFIISDDDKCDSIWQMFKLNPGLCLNFVLNQNITNRNQFVSTQLFQLQSLPTQNFILQQTQLSFVQKINSLIYVEPVYYASTFSQKEEKQIAGLLINQFNQFVDVYSFYTLVNQQLSIHHYNLELFINSRFFKSVIQIIAHFNLDNHFILILSMIQSLKSFVKNILQNSDGVQNFDYNGYILTTVEKFTGNSIFDLPRATMDVPNKQSTLSELVQLHTISNNAAQFSIKTNNFQNYIYATIPSLSHYCLLNCNKQKLESIYELLDNYLKVGFVQDNVKTLELQSSLLYSSLTPYYISLISGNTQMFYLIQFFYNFSYQQHLQAVNIAALQCNLSMLHILFNDNDESCYYKQDCIEQHMQQLNDQRSQVQGFSIPSIDTYFIHQLVNERSGETQKLYQQRMVDLHSIMTAYFTDENYPESHAPQFYQQKYRYEKQKLLVLELAQIQQNAKKLQQEIDLKVKQNFEVPQQLLKAFDDLKLQEDAISQGLSMIQNYLIFNEKQDILKKNAVQEKVEKTIQMSVYVQMNLLLSIIFNNARFCENNECYFCKYNSYISDFLLRSNRTQTDQQPRCISQQQILRTMDSNILTKNILNDHKNINNFINQQICSNIQQSMLFLLSRKGFSQLYIIFDQFKFSAPPSDLLCLKNQFILPTTNNVQFIPLSTPLTIAAQCNSESLISLSANIQSACSACGKQQQLMLMSYFNQEDYFGLTAVHHALIVFLRLGQTLINFQSIVDKFNQTISNKVYVAKFIQKLKTQFRQAFFNLQGLLAVEFTQTFKPSADGVSLRERLFMFLFSNQLLAGPGIQLLQQFKEQNKEGDFDINCELLLLIFSVTNDGMLKTQVEKAYEQHLKDQQKEQIQQLMKSTGNTNTMKKFQSNFCFYSSNNDTTKHSQRKSKVTQIINSLNSQGGNLLGLGKAASLDSIGISFNLAQHQSILKFSQSVDAQTLYNNNDLTKIVLLEVVNIVKLLINDDKPPGKDVTSFYLQTSNKFSLFRDCQPTALYSIEQSKIQQYPCQTGVRFLGMDLNIKPELLSLQQIEASEAGQIQFQIFKYSHYFAKALKEKFVDVTDQFTLPEQQTVSYIENQIFNRQLTELSLQEVPKDFCKELPHQVVHMRADAKLFQNSLKCKKQPQTSGLWTDHFSSAIPELKNNLNEEKILSMIRKLSVEDTIYCNVQNSLRFAFRLHRLFIKYMFKPQAQDLYESKYLLQHLSQMGPPLHLSLQTKELNVPKLSRIEDDFSLIEWRRLSLRVLNQFQLIGQQKINISMLPEPNHVSLRQCLNYQEGQRMLSLSDLRPSSLFSRLSQDDLSKPRLLRPAIMAPPVPIINNDYCEHLPRISRKPQRVFAFLAENSRYQKDDTSQELFDGAVIEEQQRLNQLGITEALVTQKADEHGFSRLDDDTETKNDVKIDGKTFQIALV